MRRVLCITNTYIQIQMIDTNLQLNTQGKMFADNKLGGDWLTIDVRKIIMNGELKCSSSVMSTFLGFVCFYTKFCYNYNNMYVYIHLYIIYYWYNIKLVYKFVHVVLIKSKSTPHPINRRCNSLSSLSR